MIREGAGEVQRHLRHTLESLHDHEYFKSPRGPQERSEMDKVLRSFVFRYLYYVLSDNGRLLPHLFAGAPKDKFPTSVEDAMQVDSPSLSKADIFYAIDEITGAKSHRHTGRNCGRAFQPGEPLYRCQECAYDDTCVLCISCFNPDDHVNHHVSTHICNELHDGICDCGDAEAWNVPLHCKAEEDDSDGDEEDSVFENDYNMELFEAVLEELFDHFIEVFNQNIEPLPTIQKDLTMKLREIIQDGKTQEKFELLSALAYRNQYMEAQKPSSGPASFETEQDLDKKLDGYVVLIYNDEYHNFSQATSALRQGGPDNKHTDQLTARIDGEGRAMLKCSRDLSAVIGGFFSVQTNGLSATLTPWSEYIHQEACKYMIHWVKNCLSIPNPSFQKVFREAMGKVLCSEYIRASETTDMTPVIDKYFIPDRRNTGCHIYADLSVLGKGNVIPLGHHKVLLQESLNEIALNLNNYEELKYRRYSNSRLQQILFFDNRYWKKLRKDIRRAVIPTLASSVKYKPTFSQQVVEIFNHMTRSVAFMDREPQLSALADCVVQLFTCPTTVRTIFENENFPDIMWSVIDIFTEFSKVDDGILLWQRVQKSNPSKSYSYSFKHGLYAVETLLSKVENANLILRPPEFISIVTLCKLFNGAWRIKRKEGEHVLREDQHFILYLEYTTSIYNIIRAMNRVLDSSRAALSEDTLLQAIGLLNTFLGHRTLPYKLVQEAHDVIAFKVSKQKVAFMNPVHTLFSCLIEKVPLAKAFEAVSSTKDFLTIADFSLRAAVLCSQIDVGFWVRNGMSVLHQSAYYRTNPEINSYSRDIHLNQLAFLKENDDLPRVIYNLLDRWELLGWFTGAEQYETTVYEERITNIIQQFIAFVYHILSERHFFRYFGSSAERETHTMKNIIIYSLLMKPLPYSELLKSVPDYLSEKLSVFDECLHEVSEYVEPKGLEDSGVFSLKKEMYKKIDPLRLLNMKNDFEHSATIVKTHLAEGSNAVGQVVLQPQLISPKHLDELAAHLGDFTRTQVFAKLIYKLLQACIDREDGTYLYELLHLLHGIFKDDELLRGKSSIPEAYISKPICNLLLLIDTKANVFSENAIRKADFLLEHMIRKRHNDIFESLAAYFGQDYVEQYKAKKLNQGINFEETEKDRKKRLARLRQQKIMAKFSKQQAKFVRSNPNVITDDLFDAEVRTGSDGLVCSLCQDEESLDAFVIPAYHESSPIFFYGDYTPQNFAKPWNGFVNDDDNLTFYDDLKLYSLQEARKGSTTTFVSCNHIIHYECFRRYIQKKRFSNNLFICPLCQTFSNCVLPIPHWSLRLPKSPVTVDQLLSQPSEENLINLFIDDQTPNSTAAMNMLKEVCKKNGNYDKSYGSVSQEFVTSILTCHWANTISMIEIASRIEKNTHQTLLQGKEQKFKTLRGVLSAIGWFYKCMGTPRQKFVPYVFHGEDDGPANQVFQYIVHKSLFSGAPVSETISHALAIWIRTLATQFLISSNKTGYEITYHQAVSLGPVYEAPPEFTTACSSLDQIIAIEDTTLKTKMVDLTYTMLMKTLLPTLRRCMIMLYVFSGLLSAESCLRIDGLDLSADLPFEDLPSYFQKLVTLLCKTGFVSIFNRSTIETMDHQYLRNIPMEYAGTVKLVDLAKYLNTYVTNTKQLKLRDEATSMQSRNIKNRLDFKICLTCGVRVYSRSDGTEIMKHMAKNCFKAYSLFLIPHDSEVRLVLQHPHSHISIPAPYLNSHGESGKNAIQRGDLTTLNIHRYEHLNYLWLNNEIPGYISRIMGDEFRVSIISSGVVFNFDRNVLRRQMRANVGNEESSEEEDLMDDDEMSPDDDPDFRWEVTPEEFFRDGILRLGGAPGQGGDIRDFFQFITNLRTDDRNDNIPTFQFTNGALGRNQNDDDDQDGDEILP
ncbi:AAL146Wp [Eremothecium gossypii ATCC 10895]|uniref:E3 ubiquitin-protein ligase n=1 Tax=Eremothecium gossypii (strain ATCC 10895 / CBS 109.51 / FGSC 9923 / NRRL Y-1056) TaxID=284811 RepID=Q75F74_EREGS|nr:AAL146Wp [Eremothecium gossypii ATCC 10895]AAS50220.1 AAL146Wp [Eremothecium gossypii ATCC 10895]AEY94505.1 FAAL146Wp [Eremothecium gossypii FDAG1]